MRELVRALPLFLALHGVFFGDVIAGGRSLSPSTYVSGLTPHGPVGAPAERRAPHLLDVEGAAWVDEPSPWLAHAALAAGEIPLWNAREGLGAPLAANLNSGAANPLQLPLNLRPTPRTADLYWLGRVLLLALFTWLFLRRIALAPVAAAVGASIVAYGGYTMAWIAHHPLSAEVFLPLMLVGFESGRAGRAGGWCVLVIAAACSLLGGKLQATMLCFAFVAAYAVLRATAAQGGSGSQTTLAAWLGLALAGAAAAALLLPAFELLARASGLTVGGRSDLAGFTIPWPTLASVAVPRLFVAPGRTFADGVLLSPAIGVAAVVLVALGLVANATPQRAIARFCGGWALLLFLRNAGLFGHVLSFVPVLRGISFVKYTFTGVFALAVAAAIGLDAVSAGLLTRRRASLAAGAALAICATLAAAAVIAGDPPTFPAHLRAPCFVVLAIATVAVLRHRGMLGDRVVAVGLAVATVGELWLVAPRTHPIRLDPYRPPAFVEFLRTAPAGRLLAADDLATPLTSAAAGLHDVRAIDVLTPGSYYEFFTRLVSFCERVIHFTVDPDLVVAATAPAIDLAGVRYIASHGPLPFDELGDHVRRQVTRERTARLFAGLVSFRHRGAPLAIGPVAADDGVRFAFTMRTPFVLELLADTEAPELAWGTLVATPASARLRVVVTGAAGDPIRSSLVREPGPRWREERVPLGPAGVRRRVRIRVTGKAVGAIQSTVSLGDLGFGPGAAAEASVLLARTERHQREIGALRPIFHDPALDVDVYENTNALPRAFRVRAIEPVDSLDAALTRLGEGFDFRRDALVLAADAPSAQSVLAATDRQPTADPCDARDGAATAPACAGTAAIRAEANDSLTIDTDGTTPAVLVLGDLAYPGWRATVDGRDARVLTVDGVMRGVAVAAGPHTVVFRYRPTSLAWGIVISVIALAALVPFTRWSARPRPRAMWT